MDLNRDDMKEIMNTGAQITVKNDGYHWILQQGPTRIDYWPSSEKFQVTVKTPIARGWDKMLKLLKERSGK